MQQGMEQGKKEGGGNSLNSWFETPNLIEADMNSSMVPPVYCLGNFLLFKLTHPSNVYLFFFLSTSHLLSSPENNKALQ